MNTPSASAFRLAAVAAALAAVSAAQATITVYTSQTSFTAALSAPAVDTFDSITATYLTSPTTRTAGAYSYRATATGDFYVLNNAPGQNWLSTFSSVPVTLNNFTGGVRGVGGFFFGVDANDIVLPTRTITVVATDASGSTTQTVSNASASSFIGLLSSGALTSLVISVSGTGAYVTMNDIVLGSAAAVPEPAAWALMAGGLAALALRRRRAA